MFLCDVHSELSVNSLSEAFIEVGTRDYFEKSAGSCQTSLHSTLITATINVTFWVFKKNVSRHDSWFLWSGTMLFFINSKKSKSICVFKYVSWFCEIKYRFITLDSLKMNKYLIWTHQTGRNWNVVCLVNGTGNSHTTVLGLDWCQNED